MATKEKLYSLGLVSVALISFLIFISSSASAAPVTSSVVGAHYKCDSWSNEQYPLINLFGEKDVPLLANEDRIWKCHVNKLSGLIFDSGNDYNLKIGEKLDLGNGYSIEVKDVDISGKAVWLRFEKNGQIVDDAFISADAGSDRKWICTLDNIQGVNNVAVLKVHVDKILMGAEYNSVRIDGIWLIDFANARTLKIGDKIGKFKLEKIVNGVNANKLGSLIFGSTLKSPVAAFIASPLSGKKPLIVKFTDKGTGSPTSRSWNFGDKSTSAAKNPTHKYTKTGRYTISLTVKNTAGSNTKKISNYITVK